jgi:recombination protein U
VEKQHTLCKPLRNGTGGIVSAKYEEKATVDYMGRFGERPIAFEAKHCSDDKIDLKRVEPHQCEFLRQWTENPAAIGFVLVSFRFLEFYLIPWDYWQAALTARDKRTGGAVTIEPIGTVWQTTGKASIRKDELPAEWKLKQGGNAAINYLAVVERLWKADES